MTQYRSASSLHASFVTPDLVPPGVYPAVVIESEWRPARSGDGRYVQTAFQMTEGEFKDRVVFDRHHVESASPSTVAIATRGFTALCAAVGLPMTDDPARLRNRGLLVTVGVRPRERGGDLVNFVAGYAPAPAASTVVRGSSNAPHANRQA